MIKGVFLIFSKNPNSPPNILLKMSKFQEKNRVLSISVIYPAACLGLRNVKKLCYFFHKKNAQAQPSVFSQKLVKSVFFDEKWVKWVFD
jgi:hypothetical protein